MERSWVILQLCLLVSQRCFFRLLKSTEVLSPLIRNFDTGLEFVSEFAHSY